jgi:outer membrane protein TolC
MMGKKIWTGLLLCFLSITCLHAGRPDQSAGPTKRWALDSNLVTLPPLPVVLAAAEAHSPVLKGQDAAIEIARLKTRLTQQEWLNYIKLSSNILYGTNDYFFLTQEFSGYNLESRPYEVTRYSVGFSLQLSLFDVTKRNKTTAIARQEQLLAEQRKQELKQALRQLVITQYYDAKLSYDLLSTKNEQKESSLLQAQMADIKFQNNQMDFIEYSKIIEFHNQTMSEFQKAQADFELKFALLQETIGINLRVP